MLIMIIWLRKRANDLRLSIDNRRHSQDVEVKEIGEQPFAQHIIVN